jgi:hypothetical protein
MEECDTNGSIFDMRAIVTLLMNIIYKPNIILMVMNVEVFPHKVSWQEKQMRSTQSFLTRFQSELFFFQRTISLDFITLPQCYFSDLIYLHEEIQGSQLSFHANHHYHYQPNSSVIRSREGGQTLCLQKTRMSLMHVYST